MTGDTSYYTRSKWTARAAHTLPAAASIAAALLALGCGGVNQTASDATRIAYSELTGDGRAAALQRLTALPVIVRFEKGQRVPVDLQLDSSLIELQAPELTLVARRDFYLLLHEDGGPLLSEDGVDFESKGDNYFFFGFDVQRDQPTRMRVRLGVRPQRTGEPAQR